MDMPKRIHFGNVFADDSETIETVEYVPKSLTYPKDLVNELIDAVDNWKENGFTGLHIEGAAYIAQVLNAIDKLKALEAE